MLLEVFCIELKNSQSAVTYYFSFQATRKKRVRKNFCQGLTCQNLMHKKYLQQKTLTYIRLASEASYSNLSNNGTLKIHFYYVICFFRNIQSDLYVYLSCQIRYVKNWQIFSLSDLPILGQTHFSDGMSKSYL